MRNNIKKNKKRFPRINQHACVRTRYDRFGKLRTETDRRDDNFNVAVTMNERDNSSKMYIDCPDGTSVTLSGRQLRTIMRVLTEHFEKSGKEINNNY